MRLLSVVFVFACCVAFADETAFWQERIDSCSVAGGGRVVVPRGLHVVGQLELKSNVELRLEKGAVLEALVGLEHYRVAKLPYSEGTWSAVVSAIGVTNVAITGAGEIFGNGRGWNPSPKERDAIGCSEGVRARGLLFADTCGIRLEGITLRDAACWGVVFKRCVGVVVRGVRVDSVVNWNNDGFDIEAKDVLIDGCDVNAGDDGCCIKSNDPDFIVENVLVRGCTVRSHCNALKLGTASHGTMRNIRFENCRIEAPTRVYRDVAPMPKDLSRPNPIPGVLTYLCGAGISAMSVECVDGGVVEDVVFDGISFSGCQVPIFVRGGRRMKRRCGIPPQDKCVLRNVLFRNIRGRAETSQPSTVTGVKECRPQHVRFEDVEIICHPADDPVRPTTEPGPECDGGYPEATMFERLFLPAYGLYVAQADDVTVENARFVQLSERDIRPPIVVRTNEDRVANRAQLTNPVLEGWYADPQIRRFGRTYWIFPTSSKNYCDQLSFDVFSSPDLKTWVKHPRAVDARDFTWVRGAMWAPDAHAMDGRYYVFFAANDAYPVGGKRTDGEPQAEPGIGKYGGIGVAVADRPEGPYHDLIGKPLVDQFWNGAQPIDQYVFQYKGDWYMVYGGWGRCNLVRLANDFKSLVPFADGRMWMNLTPPGYTEGSVMFERNGVWYFMYSSGDWKNDSYSVKYCTASTPFGPFECRGKVLFSQLPLATGAGHHSVLSVPGTDEWYICYHRRPIPNLSPNHRVTCLDRMLFDEKGSIRPIVMTGDR